VGKTAVYNHLVGSLSDVVLLEADILWRSEFDRPEDNYRAFFETWLRMSKNISQGGRPVVLFGAGAGVPENVEPCVERRYFSAVHYLALTCDDAVIVERLRARPAWRKCGDPEFIGAHVKFNQWLREKAATLEPPVQLLDTTGLTIEETGMRVARWIGAKIGGWPGGRMEIEVKRTNELAESERAYIDAWLIQQFAEESGDYEWSDVDWHVLLRVNGQLVSHVEIVERIGAVDGRPVKLGGIGGVVTLPEWRGRGLATATLERAAAFMCEELQVAFGLLICGRDMIPFYSRLGWQVVAGPLVFDQPGGKVVFDDVTMVLPCVGQEWPEGAIDLCGLPW
jgi:GNAT superfamily N-acetyltransferase